MFAKILIANRGEIACRAIRIARGRQVVVDDGHALPGLSPQGHAPRPAWGRARGAIADQARAGAPGPPALPTLGSRVSDPEGPSVWSSLANLPSAGRPI